MKLDEYQLGVKRIKVAISNPPKRTAATGEGEIPKDDRDSGFNPS